MGKANLIKKEASKFTVYFLYDDEKQSAYVEEVEEIDFSKVIQHVNVDGSVFISPRRSPYGLEEMQDEALKRSGKKKKARLRTRGPYRKAFIR